MAIGKTLTIYLAADTSKLTRGVREAETGLAAFGTKLDSMIVPALIGATVAAGAFAVSMAVDGVQAAMAEEAELTRLSTTLTNLGFEKQTDNVNAFIDELQYAGATADSDLRPAFERLLRSTNSVSDAQNALKLALDVSVGSGKSLESVANALGKAFDGNMTALGKLGIGIDQASLKSGDLKTILGTLAGTFEGQASKAAGTLEGQVKTLGIAFDELKESFGKGLLEGIGDTSNASAGLVKQLRQQQESAEFTGKALGWLGQQVVNMYNDYADNTGITAIQNAISLLMGTADAANTAGTTILGWVDAFQQIDRQVRGGYSGIPASKSFFSMEEWRDKIDKMKVSATSSTKATGGLTKSVQEMDPALRRQIDLVKSLTSTLDGARTKLDEARKAMADWVNEMAGKITGGIDLEAAFTAQFDDLGKATGISLVDGFQKQIDQAGIFADYLKTINREGGPELRDAIADIGPAAGTALAKQIIDEGLAKTFQSKLVDVRNMAETTAMTMVPAWATAGVASAVEFVSQTQMALAEATSVLEDMGRKMGSTIGEAAAEEIRKALEAAGVAQAGSVATVAGTAGTVPVTAAEVRAQVAQRIDNPFMNATAIMQAIQQGIQDSNQRLGRTGQAVLQ